MTDPLLRAKLQVGLGDGTPAVEPVISLAEVFASEPLETVTEKR